MENYRYWQTHGSGWLAEYCRRKTYIPYYHLQELLIATLASNAAPAKILEFGCGVGRHLSYLHRIPGIAARGFDQSPTMVAEIERWAPPGFTADHVVVGEPVGRLPFADGEFDIVFTCEVLVHVRPEDISGILSELLRVSRKLVFHLEPSPSTTLHSTEHNGCWGHDLAAHYRDLGESPKIMPKLFECQLPIVIERAAHSFTVEKIWPGDIISELSRKLEHDLSSIIDTAVADGTLGIDRGLDFANACERQSFDQLPRGELTRAVKGLLDDREQLQTRLAAVEAQVRYFEKYGSTPRCDRRNVSESFGTGLVRKLRQKAVRVELVESNPLSKGCEVWIRHFRRAVGDPPMPWSTIDLPAGWSFREASESLEGMAVYGTAGHLELPDGEAPSLSFMRHPWSGRARIKWRGQQEIVDLYSAEADNITINLADVFNKGQSDAA